MILTIKQILHYIIYETLYYLFTVLNYIVPKSKKQIYIYDRDYKKDNVWAISEYLSSNKKYEDYKIYYYTKCKLTNKKNITYINNSIINIWFKFRSKYIFYSYKGMKTFKTSRGQMIIDTMHGSPLKNIGYLSNDLKFKKIINLEKKFTYILCMSDFFKNVIKKSFGASLEQCLVLGYPRNDYMFSNEKKLKNLEIDKNNYNKVILWMPTWRGNRGSKKNKESDINFPIINKKNIYKLNELLIKKDILILIKPHPVQLKLDILSKNYSNIKIIDNDILNQKQIYIYEIFNEIDALLTDYSSVYFDFLLTMKPIGFTIDDFDSYGKNRGFVVDNPLDLMPGEKITDFDELISFISDINDGKDLFFEERKKINDMANKYKDGNNTKRILDYLGL